MSMLAPWFLLGGLAVGLPILFHMLRRTPRGMLPFSSLMFLEPSPPRITRRSRIEHWLLLVLRGLVLVGLALAFARPFLRDDASLPVGRGPGRLVAVVIDRSASMRREGLWADLRAELRERLDGLGPEDRVAVFSFADALETHVSFEQGRGMDAADLRRLVRTKVDELEPGWGGSALGAAVVDVAERLHAEQEERVPRPAAELWLASDLEAGADVAALQATDWPAGVVVRLLPTESSRPTNAGLQLLESRDDAGDDAIRVRVTNTPDATRDEFSITAWGAESGGRAPTTAPLTVHVPPGESRVIAVPALPESEAIERVVLAGDDHPFDNTVWIAPSVVVPRTVVYVGGDDPGDVRGPRFYLEKVFMGSGRRPVHLVASEGLADDRGSAAPTGPALVVVAGGQPAIAAARLQKIVADGGRVLLVPSSAAELQSLLEPWNDAPLTVTEATVPRYALLGEIDFQHPLFAPFAEARFSDFRSIHFWKHRQIDVPQDSPWRVVARFDGGTPAMLERPVGAGSVVVLASGWQPAESQLARSSKFAPLMLQLLPGGSADAAKPRGAVVGRPVPLPRSDQAGTITTPAGVSRPLAEGEAELLLASEPGIHVVRRGAAAHETVERIAVNVPPDESRTAPLAPAQLADLGLPLEPSASPAAVAADAQRQKLAHRADLEKRQQLWRWLVAAALGLVIGETWLASRCQSSGGKGAES